MSVTRSALKSRPIIDVLQVVAVLIGAGHQVGRAGDRLIHHDQGSAHAQRRGVAGDRANGVDLLIGGRAHLFGLDGVGQLGLIDFHVAADHGEHKLLDNLLPSWHAGDHKDRLGRFSLGNAQEVRQVGDGLGGRGSHFF